MIINWILVGPESYMGILDGRSDLGMSIMIRPDISGKYLLEIQIENCSTYYKLGMTVGSSKSNAVKYLKKQLKKI